MDVKTLGIVLRCSKYSDNNYIVQILTKSFGKISFAVYSPQNKRAKVRASMLQPLSLLELEMDNKPSRTIQHIKDARMLNLSVMSPEKVSMAMFVADVVWATTVDALPDADLFNKVESVVNSLESDQGIDGHFAIRFLLEYADILGFNPAHDMENLLLREFLGTLVETDDKELFIRLVEAASAGNINIFNHRQRQILLRTLLLYYKLNLPDMPAVKSVDVLEEIFS